MMSFPLVRWLAVTFMLAGTPGIGLAAALLSQTIDPPQVNVGDPTIVTLTVQNGSMGRVQLPHVEGITVNGTNLQIKSIDENGSYYTTVSMNFSITPTRAGDFTIPAFDLHTQEGETLHVRPMKLHVLGDANAPSNNNQSLVVTPVPASVQVVTTPVAPPGPVVMPPGSAHPTNATSTGADVSPPRGPDGTPAQVFLIIHSLTSEAYVGQAIPLEIDFFIRTDVNADQNSLPTIKGSDFLMNNFTIRGHETLGMLEGEQYYRETWITAVSAPKSGSFPLAMTRDTYWIKSITSGNADPFSGFYNRQANLAHEPVDSNPLTIHVLPLPDQGRPPHFTGAIGDYKVTANTQTNSVAVGEPVKVRFVVSGEGNFDYVRCPALADDPAWKIYTPVSNTNFIDESRTHAVKTFDQSVIPQKNGTLPLPAASFSYFDPSAKQYVTIPISLPVVTVTGAPLSPTPIATDAEGSSSTAGAVKPDQFMPNRADAGSPQFSLLPTYRRTWFWAAEAGLFSLPILGLLLLWLRRRSAPDTALMERTSRQRFLRQDEDAMADAVRRNDATGFFLAARHAISLQLGARWNLKPEALTLGEIRQRDPELAGTLEPLFRQVDEVIYSGHAAPGIDLAPWDERVRAELLQLQTA